VCAADCSAAAQIGFLIALVVLLWTQVYGGLLDSRPGRVSGAVPARLTSR